MKRSLDVAIEAHQEYGVVTYDLAVAPNAYSIQTLDAPRLDKLLTMLWNFHLELAFYGVIGTFMNESGAEYLLTESGILAEGSLMSFIRGKYYNRCVQIHDILALGMERKLYDTFISFLLGKWRMSSMTSSLMFLKTAVHRNSFLRQVQSSNNIWGNSTCIWRNRWMETRLHRDLMRTLRINYVDGYIKILPAMIDIFLD